MDSILMRLSRFNRKTQSRVLVGLLAFFLMFSVVLPMNGTQAETAEAVITEPEAAEYAGTGDNDAGVAEGVVEGLGNDPAANEEETGGEVTEAVPEDEYVTGTTMLTAAEMGDSGIVALSDSYKDVDGVTYTLDGRVLVAYPAGNSRPLYEVLPGTEEIGANAFYGATHLMTIVLPDSLRTISSGAFYGCTNLTTINLPEGLRTIGANAFARCEYLPAITFPASLTSIANGASNTGAFNGCTRLASVTFNNSKASIGNYTFSGVTSLRELDLGSSITAIGSYAFNGCTGLSTVIVDGDSVNIDQYAFYNCTGLRTISIKSNSVSIGQSAFQGCTALTSLVFEDTVTTIGVYSFYGCTRLENVDFGDKLVSIGNAAFMHCPALTELTFPASLTSIASGNATYWAFGGCANLAKVTFADSEAVIGDRAFVGCTKLTEVNFGSKIKTIGNYAFYNTGLTDVRLPASVYSLGIGSFAENANLKTVKISEGVYSIGADSFINCPLLESITVDDKNAVYIDIDGVLFEYDYILDTAILIKYPPNKEGVTYSVPGNVVEIAANAFHSAQKLTLVSLPEGLRTIGAGAFAHCIRLAEITFPSSLTSIANGANNSGAFYGCTILSRVVFNDSAATIGNYTFSGLANLRDVDFGSKITAIGNYAFNGCTGLVILAFPEDLRSIGQYAFNGCTGLRTVSIECGSIDIGTQAFFNNTGLRTIRIKGDTINIGQSAFQSCTALTSLVIENSVTTIGTYAFYSCTKLEYVDFGENLISIGNGAFMHCSSLTELTFPASLTSIASGNATYWAFGGCTNLAKVTFANSATVIGDRAFFGLAKLTEVNFGSKLVSIGNSAFASTGLKEVLVPASTLSIGSQGFANCPELVIAYICSRNTSRGPDTFIGCGKLEYIICPYPTEGKILITVVPEHGGSASGTGEYAVGDQVRLLATPNNGYNMDGWYLNGQKVGSDRQYNFTVTNTTESSTYVAKFNFIGEHHTISATPAPASGGTITGTGNYVDGSLVTLRAIANQGFDFEGWYEGGVKIEGVGAMYSFSATADRVLTAKFTVTVEHTISVIADPLAGGTVTGGGKYALNATATVKAVANTG